MRGVLLLLACTAALTATSIDTPSTCAILRTPAGGGPSERVYEGSAADPFCRGYDSRAGIRPLTEGFQYPAQVIAEVWYAGPREDLLTDYDARISIDMLLNPMHVVDRFSEGGYEYRPVFSIAQRTATLTIRGTVPGSGYGRLGLYYIGNYSWGSTPVLGRFTDGDFPIFQRGIESVLATYTLTWSFPETDSEVAYLGAHYDALFYVFPADAPVPEPASFVLAGTGALVMLARKKLLNHNRTDRS